MGEFDIAINGGLFKDKTVLVTGGVGSIGSALVRKILAYQPKTIRVLDINETGLFDLNEELKSGCLRTFVGDVRDKERLEKAMEGADIVFHAAALKHVPLCEYNPFEAIKTNVIGTQNVLDAALGAGVDKVIFISTDKAVNPSNVMGATKLLAERLTISANLYKGDKRTKFSCVRFGNVMGSRGSVIPLFTKQIQNGEAVTVTDPDMTRFIMSIPRSVELIMMAAQIAEGGEIFILKMPAVLIGDLAEVMIKFIPNGGHPSKITIIGKRPGEKMFEELIDPQEENVYEDDSMFVILPSGMNHIYSYLDKFKKSQNKSYSSDTAQILNTDGIEKLLNDISIIKTSANHTDN